MVPGNAGKSQNLLRHCTPLSVFSADNGVQCYIAILSMLSKVMEQCFEKCLTKYLTIFNILCALQFGFYAGYSTNLVLLSFPDKLKDYIDAGNYAGAVFIDLTITFDLILHNISITKLNVIGAV